MQIILLLGELQVVAGDVLLGVHAKDAIIGRREDFDAGRDGTTSIVGWWRDLELLAVGERVAQIGEGIVGLVREEILHDEVFLRGRVFLFPLVPEVGFPVGSHRPCRVEGL